MDVKEVKSRLRSLASYVKYSKRSPYASQAIENFIFVLDSGKYNLNELSLSLLTTLNDLKDIFYEHTRVREDYKNLVSTILEYLSKRNDLLLKIVETVRKARKISWRRFYSEVSGMKKPPSEVKKRIKEEVKLLSKKYKGIRVSRKGVCIKE